MTNTPAVLQSYIDGLKAHDVQKVASTVSESLSFVLPNKTLNKSQFLAMLRALYAAFPDWHYEHARPDVRETDIAIKWRQRGTHSGAFVMPGREPIEATGRIVTIPEQFFFYKIGHRELLEIRPDPVAGGAPQGILEQIGATL